jgi:hypothetical protein
MSLSRASLVDIDDLISLNEADFRQRFEIAFKLDPTLTATKLYQNLVEADFDEQKAVRRLRLSLARLRNPSEFPIPRFLAPQTAITSTNSIPTPTNENASPTQSGFSPEKPTISGCAKKRPAPHRQAVDSDDEPLIPIRSEPESTRPIISPFRRSPHKIPDAIENNSFNNDIGVTDDEGQDSQPKKRRLHILPLRPTDTSTVSSPKSTKRQKSFSSGSKKIPKLKSTQYFQTTATLRSFSEENDLAILTLKERNVQSSRKNEVPLEDESLIFQSMTMKTTSLFQTIKLALSVRRTLQDRARRDEVIRTKWS